MRRKKYKGRCVKVSISKSNEVCRTYDDIQLAYLNVLQCDDDIKEIQCNVIIADRDGVGDDYTTDFLCTKINGDLMVRECIFRRFLLKPMTAKLLDLSRTYWLKKGINDWGIIIDAEE